MSRTITAMFDSREEAEAARERLQDSSIEASRIRILDRASGDGATNRAETGLASSDASGSGDSGGGFWATLRDMFMPDEDRHTFGEGINRGHFMIVADVDEDAADAAIGVLESSSSVDLEQRSGEWRQQGWGGRYEQGSEANDRQSGAFGPIGDDHDQLATGGIAGAEGSSGLPTDRSTDRPTDRMSQDQHRIGLRDPARGGARVRSYLRDPSMFGADDESRSDGDRSAFFGTDRDRDQASDDAERARDPSFGRRDS